jgi:TolB protein
MLVIVLMSLFVDSSDIERLTFDGLDKQRPSWSRDGRTLAFSRHETGGTHIWQYLMKAGDPKSAHRVTNRAVPDYDGEISPDGKQMLVVFVKQSGTQGNLDIALTSIEGGEPKIVAEDQNGKLSHQEWPSWSPDGKRFAFSSTHEGNQEIYMADVDGKNVSRITQSPGTDSHPCWTPDGKSLLFTTDRWGGLEIGRINIDGSGLKRLTHSRGLDDYPAVAPDGKRFAFVSNRDGNLEVYVANIDGSSPVNISNHPRRDTMPTWRPDGKSVTFVSERAGGVDVFNIRTEHGSGRPH